MYCHLLTPILYLKTSTVIGMYQINMFCSFVFPRHPCYTRGISLWKGRKPETLGLDPVKCCKQDVVLVFGIPEFFRGECNPNWPFPPPNKNILDALKKDVYIYINIYMCILNITYIYISIIYKYKLKLHTCHGHQNIQVVKHDITI